MERSRDHDKIATALAEARPFPRPEFAAELDRWAATGFPRRNRGNSRRTALADRLRNLAPRRPAFAIAAVALVAIAIATALVASNDSSSPTVALDGVSKRRPHHQVQFSETVRPAGKPQIHRGGETLSRLAPFSREVPSASDSVQRQSASALPRLNSASATLPRVTLPRVSSASANASFSAAGARNRNIERSAEIGLLADPTDVADDSAKVFAAVHDANGIVLHSTTSSGRNGGARFELLIPSARLGDALAAFSSIDEVRSRHEATDDITKPTVTVSEELQDSQAQVNGLLAQLSGSEVESEREAISAELRAERAHAARLRNQLARLQQRTTYSRVLVRIQSGESTESGGAWGIGDAFGDAGHILGIAAGVTVVGLAVIAPLALLCLLAWLAQRLWLRSRRERALDA
jgi:hypothetical protein